jgi:TolB-like protein
VPSLDRPAVHRWSLIALLALAAAGALAVVAVRHWRGRPARTRIVVAVFANRTGDPELEQFGSMAADWVTRGLARTPTVEVVDLGAVYVEGRTASGQPTDPLALARRNGAGSVVAGSYYVSEDTLAVRSTVIDGTTGEVLETVTPVRVGRNESVKALELLQQQVMTAVAGTAAELRAHGDSTGARQAAERAVAWYGGGTDDRLRGRYERLWFARSLMMLGRLDEALAAAVVGNRTDSTDVSYIGLRGVLAGYRGATDQALEQDQRLAALEPSGPRGSTWVWRARIAAARGDRAAALEHLRIGSEQGVPRVGIGVDIHADPIFEPLRGDSTFEAILRSGE